MNENLVTLSFFTLNQCMFGITRGLWPPKISKKITRGAEPPESPNSTPLPSLIFGTSTLNLSGILPQSQGILPPAWEHPLSLRGILPQSILFYFHNYENFPISRQCEMLITIFLIADSKGYEVFIQKTPLSEDNDLYGNHVLQISKTRLSFKHMDKNEYILSWPFTQLRGFKSQSEQQLIILETGRFVVFLIFIIILYYMLCWYEVMYGTKHWPNRDTWGPFTLSSIGALVLSFTANSAKKLVS